MFVWRTLVSRCVSDGKSCHVAYKMQGRCEAVRLAARQRMRVVIGWRSLVSLLCG